MARLIHASVEAPRPCPYLPGVPASQEHRLILDVEPDEAERLLERGWRHFGPAWFRPACPGCSACLSTRILVDEFVPSRSQRRVQRRARRLRVVAGEPTFNEARLALFHVWHHNRAYMRGWEPASFDAGDYHMRFAFSSPFAREVAYYDDEAGGRLVMVSICDETPNAWSAVFCFYDPAYARISPGLANVLELIGLARLGGQRSVYLGYCVFDCQSLCYKAAFRPQEVLLGLPGDDDAPCWQRFDLRSGINPGSAPSLSERVW